MHFDFQKQTGYRRKAKGRIKDGKTPITKIKNQNFKEFTITRVIFCPFHPKKPQEEKNCKEFTLKR